MPLPASSDGALAAFLATRDAARVARERWRDPLPLVREQLYDEQTEAARFTIHENERSTTS